MGGDCCGKDSENMKDAIEVKETMPEYKVIVVGDSAVGKTAIIH